MRAVLLTIALGLAGCTTTTTMYSTETMLVVNQVDGLWRDGRYRYVRTALSGSAHAATDSHESRDIAIRAMNRLVKAADLGPNQALVDVTMEVGTTEREGRTIRIVTMRGDVVEFLR